MNKNRWEKIREFIQEMIAGFGRWIDYNTANWIFTLNYEGEKFKAVKEPGLNGNQFRSSLETKSTQNIEITEML